jgi:hypothetical protein
VIVALPAPTKEIVSPDAVAIAAFEEDVELGVHGPLSMYPPSAVSQIYCSVVTTV